MDSANAYVVSKELIDCYWFLKNLCRKGDSCEYRHSQDVLGNTTVCSKWMMRQCHNKQCKDRHPSGPHLFQKMAPCYYFQQGNCSKGISCPFSHDIGGDDEVNRKREELRKLQEERKREEERIAQLRAQQSQLGNRKRKPEDQPQQTKKEKTTKEPFHVQARNIIQQGRQIQLTQKKGKEDKPVPLAVRTLAELKKEGMQTKKKIPIEKRNQKTSNEKVFVKKDQNIGKKNQKKEEDFNSWHVKSLEEIQKEKDLVIGKDEKEIPATTNDVLLSNQTPPSQMIEEAGESAPQDNEDQVEDEDIELDIV